MLNHLDEMLRHLLLTNPNLGQLQNQAQIGFGPPDDEWRGQGGQQIRLNIYLVDLRSDREMRTGARQRSRGRNPVEATPPPAWMAAHYLLSAWSSASLQAGPTREEHELLYAVAAVLYRHAPLKAAEIYANAPGQLQNLPALLQEETLPTRVLPPEGFAKLSEFWGTMGSPQPWKPAIYLVVSVPVALLSETIGATVTTRVIEFERNERWIQIAGRVADNAGNPIAEARLMLETDTGTVLQETETDETGRFSFSGLRAGRYRLRAEKDGLGIRRKMIQVPDPNNNYDVTF